MKSMTGYATLDRHGMRWELRSVNARGLDVKLRLPDGAAGLEPRIRGAVADVVARGNVTLSLRAAAQTDGPSVDGLARAAAALLAAETAAAEAGLDLRPVTATDLLARLTHGQGASVPDPTVAQADLADLLAAFDADRLREGAALRDHLDRHLTQIADAHARATALAPDRTRQAQAALQAALDRLDGAAVDDARLAQELALLAIKADVTEELDRLDTHLDAARALLDDDGPVGRRLDFLTQEMMREANTLCAKSGLAPLTAIGLDMKTAIDRLREQVQNIE